MSDKSSDKLDQNGPTVNDLALPIIQHQISLEDVLLTCPGVMESICSYLNLADTNSFVSSTKKINTVYKDNTLIWRRHARLITHIEHHLTSFNIN
jgi:hypothetical protein